MANQIDARIQLKIDTEANWMANASSFRPKLGELIIYSPDEKYSSPRFKVGDGNTLLSHLPFSNGDLTMKNDTYNGWYNSEYKPKMGEIIIINSEVIGEPAQVRIGDGDNLVKDLPVFGGASGSSANAQKLVNTNGQGLNVATQGNRLIYFKDGVPTASNIYVYKTVPQDAVLTELATETEKGLLAPEEKVLLNELSEKAITKDNISSSLPTASETVKGGVMIGENLIIDNGVLSAVMPEEIEDATTTASGLMSAEDKRKLNNIEAEANKTIVDSALSTTSTNPIQNKVINSEITKLGSLITQENSATLTAAKNYTNTKISDLINSAPTTLDTLGEIAEAMTANQNVVQALDGAIGSKANASDLTATSDKLDLHTTSKDNPHAVTATQVGLGNVENKSVATIKNEILTKTNLKAVGVSFDTYGEFAGADAGLVPASAGEENKYLAANGEWKTINAPEINYPVTSVNGETGAVNITAESLGALTEVPAEYVTETELTNKGYSTFSGNYSDLSGTPNFAKVATSGKYNDLTDIPAAITVDANLTSTGINPVQGKTIYTALAGKQPIGDYALKSDIPTVPVTSVNGKTGAVQLTIPTDLSQLNETPYYRTVSDSEKATWNAKSDFNGNYNNLTNKPTIPTISVSNLASSGNTICTLTINNTPYTLRAPAGESLPIASSTVLGGVKIGSGIAVNTNGTISVTETSLNAILTNYAKSSEIPNLTNYVTKDYLTNQNYAKTSQIKDYSGSNGIELISNGSTFRISAEYGNSTPNTNNYDGRLFFVIS